MDSETNSKEQAVKAMWENRGRSDSSVVEGKSFASSIVDNDSDASSSRSRPSLFSMQNKQHSATSLLGTSESWWISMLKLPVFFALFLAVCAVAAATYLNLTADEKDNFEESVCKQTLFRFIPSPLGQTHFLVSILVWRECCTNCQFGTTKGETAV